MTRFTAFLNQLTRNDVSLAGGKGASLGEMTQDGIPIPPGFVILADTFDAFLDSAHLVDEIDAILDKVNHDDTNSVEKASEKIQALILNVEITADIRSEIISQFEKLGTEYVAVRSSATAEDSSAASWAGELESYLNTTKKTLIENVKKCWASLFTPRAIFYRFEKGLAAKRISVAVVVQKMVNSYVSGVAFSVHPVTKDTNQLIIEAAFGLGEAIVSGSVTPDSYVVNKRDFTIMDIRCVEQERMLIRNSLAGNRWVKLGSRKNIQKLTEEQIIELAKLVVRIEDHYKFPVDVEWAMEGNRFFITQSRPITTL